jgi:hypothetical protein
MVPFLNIKGSAQFHRCRDEQQSKALHQIPGSDVAQGPNTGLSQLELNDKR